MTTDHGAFVSAEDGVQFFPTVEKAAGHLEAIDVEEGVYDAFFTLTGVRLRPEVLDESNVALRPSGTADPKALCHLLRTERDRGRLRSESDPDDPTAVANEMLLQQWSVRWPRWPRWLDHRLHGEYPPQV